MAEEKNSIPGGNGDDREELCVDKDLSVVVGKEDDSMDWEEEGDPGVWDQCAEAMAEAMIRERGIQVDDAVEITGPIPPSGDDEDLSDVVEDSGGFYQQVLDDGSEEESVEPEEEDLFEAEGGVEAEEVVEPEDSFGPEGEYGLDGEPLIDHSEVELDGELRLKSSEVESLDELSHMAQIAVRGFCSRLGRIEREMFFKAVARERGVTSQEVAEASGNTPRGVAGVVIEAAMAIARDNEWVSDPLVEIKFRTELESVVDDELGDLHEQAAKDRADFGDQSDAEGVSPSAE